MLSSRVGGERSLVIDTQSAGLSPDRKQQRVQSECTRLTGRSGTGGIVSAQGREAVLRWLMRCSAERRVSSPPQDGTWWSRYLVSIRAAGRAAIEWGGFRTGVARGWVLFSSSSSLMKQNTAVRLTRARVLKQRRRQRCGMEVVRLVLTARRRRMPNTPAVCPVCPGSLQECPAAPHLHPASSPS